MPAPKKAEEKAPKAPEETKDAPEERDAPPAPPPPSKGKPKEKNAPPPPSLPELRPREWFDYVLPNTNGEGMLGFFSRAKPKDPEG